jgi:glycosyltransferase involved in cell wall biosynthesis
MNIFVLPSWFPPEGGEFFAQQAHSLARQGHDVTVCAARSVTLRTPLRWFRALFALIYGPTYAPDRNLAVYTLTYPTLRLGLKLKVGLYCLFLSWCFRRATQRSNKPDIIHVHSVIWAGVAAERISRQIACPYFITEHRSRFVENDFVSSSDRKEMNHVLIREALTFASRVAAVSSSMLPALCRLGGLNENQLTVIPNMVDVDFFQPQPPINDLRFRFFSLGNLVALKGFLDLVEAFSLVARERSAELVIGGEGPHRRALEQRIRDLGLTDTITLKGNLSRHGVRQEMSSARSFVLASHYEAFGVVFIEAMAMGLPLVGTRSGGPEEVITSDLGLLSPVGDIEALAANLIRMIDTYEDFDRIRIRQRAVDLYAEDIIAQRLTLEFEEVIRSWRMTRHTRRVAR